MKIKQYILSFWPIYLIVTLSFLVVTQAGSRAISAMAENTPVERLNTIIIDAGHGGEDGGATSCTGALESHINLQIAIRLNDLCHLLGYETVMVRTNDVSIYTEGNSIAQKKVSDLKQRVKIVNDTENGILISIHQNTFPESKYSGAQVFYNTVTDSEKLAKTMQSFFVQSINPGSNRQCKQATGVYLMEHIERPGVLVECGFLSNLSEEAALRTEEYQKRICCVIVSALSSYLNT